jgi:hypothetical protein
MNARIMPAPLAAALAVIAVPMIDAAAQSQKSTHQRHAAYRPLYHPSTGFRGCVDCYPDGWRLRSTARGWDNTCINASWLPSAFACSAK